MALLAVMKYISLSLKFPEFWLLCVLTT